MIKTEEIKIEGKKYKRTTTDLVRLDKEGNALPNLLQVETGREYFDAVDNLESSYSYLEITELEKENEVVA